MSSEETKHVLERCGSVVNDNKSRPRKKQVNLLKARQRQELEAEKEDFEKTIENARFYKAPVNIGQIHKMKRDIELQLEEQSPYPAISPETKDALNKRRVELEAQIKDGMLPTEVMRRNPSGAVGHNVQWQKKNTARVLEWQNIKRQLDPDSQDPDISNIERLRPSLLRADGVSTYMANAQIPGVHAMTPLAKDNFPADMGEDVDSALAQVKAREVLDQIQNDDDEPKLVTKEYLHKDGHIRRKAAFAFKEKECFCGCRQMFTPRNAAQKFVNTKHKENYNVRKNRETREALEVGEDIND